MRLQDLRQARGARGAADGQGRRLHADDGDARDRPLAGQGDAAARRAAAAAAATAASSPVFDDSPAKPAIEAYSRKIVSDGAQILQRRALGDRTNTADSRICTSTWQKGLGAGRPKPARELPPE